jgi:zinc protease
VPSVALFADIVRNPAFPAGEMEHQRVRWLAAIEREENEPVSMALRTLPPLLYGTGHAYGIPFTGSGTADSIRALSRDDLVAFHGDWIRPDNATLFVVGDTTLGEILPVLEQSFGAWRPPARRIPAKPLGDVPLPQASRVLVIDKPGAPQS